MPNPKLETYKNKATGTVYDYTDAAAQASIAAIEEKIPDVASSENQLVTEAGLNNVLNFKEDKVPGKGLSTNDYDDTEKAKVAGAFPRSEQAVLGAKNLLPNNNTTQTINGIPFTKNADGSVTIGAGTASANTSYILGDINPKAGNYILSRGTTNGQAFLSVSKYNGSTWVAGLAEIGNQAISEKEFTIDYVGYDTVRGFLYIGSGVTISTPYTVYPMIRVASDKDDTYVPYAMTNQQLTDAAKLRTVIPTIDGTIVKTYKGGLVAYNLLTRVCTFGVRLVVGAYANYANFMTGLPKAKSIYSFPCVCTNFARNVGMAVLTTSADGGMYFTGLGQAANFADGDELNISGSYIIADDVVS